MIDEHKLAEILEQGLKSITYPAQPAALYNPVEYTLESGGKRLRPLLTLAVAQALGLDPQKAVNQAMGVEMFHNFTLIHDDVMDRSALRRGRPTVYKRWGAVQAILSGDALLTMATQRVALCEPAIMADVLDLFNTTAMEVYEGQQFDMDFESRDDVSVGEYLNMIRLKTSVLLGCACAMGAIVAGADRATRNAFYDYGVNLGLAFQLRDDWLDTFGDAEIFGKPIGGDIVNRKKTWLFITAMTEAPGRMSSALSGTTERTELIAAVTDIYRSLNLSERCAKLIDRHRADAVAALESANLDGEHLRWFVDLANNLSNRSK